MIYDLTHKNNVQSYKIRIKGKNRPDIFVDFFQGNNHGINVDYEYSVFLHSNTTIKNDSLLGKIKLTLYDKVVTCGVISNITSLDSNRQLFYYKITISSPLMLLKISQTPRTFTKLSNKTILHKILVTQYSLNVIWKIKSKRIVEHDLYMQYNETDFEFFERLLKESNLHYYFIFENNLHYIVISDNPYDTSLDVGIKYLECIEDKLINDTKPKISSWEAICLDNSSCKDVNMKINASTNAFSLIPGQIIKVKLGNHLDRSIYYIESIQEYGSQQRLSPNKYLETKNHNPLYENNITLRPISYIKNFNINNAHNYRHKILYLTGKIVSRSNSNFPDIDKEGKYLVKFPFDTESKLSSTTRLKLSQQYSRNTHGTHFPLHPGAYVVISFLYGNYNKPVIIGSLPHPKFSSPVTNKNLTQSIIQSFNYNCILMEDKIAEEHIKFSNHNNFIKVNAKKDSNSINIYSKYGSINFYSDNNSKLTVGKDIKKLSKSTYTQINNSYYLNIEKNYNISTKNLVEINSKNSIKLEVRKNCDIASKNNIKFNSKYNFSLLSKGNISISSTNKNINIRSYQELSILSNSKNSFRINMANSFIECTPGATLKIKAPTIKINSPNIINLIDKVEFI